MTVYVVMKEGYLCNIYPSLEEAKAWVEDMKGFIIIAATLGDPRWNYVHRDGFTEAELERLNGLRPLLYVKTSPEQYAKALKHLLQHGYTVESLAESIGKSPEWIKSKLE